MKSGYTSEYNRIQHDIGRGEVMVNHIHSFSLHLTVLIILKGILTGRGSRLISDKLDLGFQYPCDGPARGGTCQVSPWDHLFLALFWMYNLISVLIFHYFWKMQSDIWCLSLTSNRDIGSRTTYLTWREYGVESVRVNGWLRNYLWSEATQVIQSYRRDGISGYTYIFLSSHFIWSFSLMYLYSGRAYWEELIESILWGHTKIKITPNIQPRALSITQGRAVGLCHYLLGGVGCTWSFFLARIEVLVW